MVKGCRSKSLGSIPFIVWQAASRQAAHPTASPLFQSAVFFILWHSLLKGCREYGYVEHKRNLIVCQAKRPLNCNLSVTIDKWLVEFVTQGFSPEKFSPEGLSYRLWLTKKTITEGLRLTEVFRCRNSYSPRKRLAQRVETRLLKLDTRALRLTVRSELVEGWTVHSEQACRKDERAQHRLLLHELPASTRLPTPPATRPRSTGNLVRLSMSDNGTQAGNGGQVPASSPLNGIFFDLKPNGLRDRCRNTKLGHHWGLLIFIWVAYKSSQFITLVLGFFL